jgi:Ca-activated chloride channel family protein
VTLVAGHWLWLLAGVAALTALYVAMQARRRRYAVRFANLPLLESVVPRRPGWRRHVPAVLVALSLAALCVAMARPARVQRVPREEATVMLAIDTSASMAATDVTPTRLDAARTAAEAFVDDLPDRLRVGIVTFDRAARVIAPPTTDHSIAREALRDLETGPGTAAGEGIYASLAAIQASRTSGGSGGGADRDRSVAAIVLLSDGVTTVGRPVEEAARAAAQARVPVSTIAFGTPDGTVDVLGQAIPVPADPDTMRAVAETSAGRFFEAGSEEQLRKVYENIGTRVGYTTRTQEMTTAFVAFAIVLLLLGAALAVVWTGRLL